MDPEAIEEEEFAILNAAEPPAPVLELARLQEPIRRLLPLTPILIAPTATVGDAVHLMRERRAGCVLIVEEGRLAGIFTERDLLYTVGLSPLERPVYEVMTRNPDVLRPDDPIVYALNLMSVGGYRHVPLVDDAHRPVGVVSMRHIVHYLVAFFPQAILTLPPDPMRAEEWRERDGA
jgi:CBS domain-containing protein